MDLQPFKLERYFAQYEFSAPFLLSCSDCEPLTLKELLTMADDELLYLWENLQLGYTESRGNPLLRQEIAKLHTRIKKDDVLVLTPEEGIYIAMRALLCEGDEIVVVAPFYQSLGEVAKSQGCTIKEWDVRTTHDPSSIMSDKTKMLVMNFPHNPTGETLTRAELDNIIQIAKKHNIIIFADEMYHYLDHDGDSLPFVCDLYKNAITLFGVSKTFSLPGLRIGWLATQNHELLDKLATYKDYTTICSSAPSEILALMALRAKEKILARNLSIIRKNLIILDGFFSRHKQFSWKKPLAGPIAFPEYAGDVDVFCLDLVEKKGVMLLPASTYGVKSNHFRIGFARKNMSEALKRLELYLAEH